MKLTKFEINYVLPAFEDVTDQRYILAPEGEELEEMKSVEFKISSNLQDDCSYEGDLTKDERLIIISVLQEYLSNRFSPNDYESDDIQKIMEKLRWK